MRKISVLVLFMTLASAFVLPQTPRSTSRQPGNSLLEVLKAKGNFNTLISLIEIAKFQDLGVGSKTKMTLLAPNDEAFANCPESKLEKLKQDPEAIRDLVRAHLLPGRLSIQDMLVPVAKGSSRTFREAKNADGNVIGFQCNGHTGEHHPVLNNGAARIGRGDIIFAQGVIHEINAVLVCPPMK